MKFTYSGTGCNLSVVGIEGVLGAGLKARTSSSPSALVVASPVRSQSNDSTRNSTLSAHEPACSLNVRSQALDDTHGPADARQIWDLAKRGVVVPNNLSGGLPPVPEGRYVVG